MYYTEKEFLDIIKQTKRKLTGKFLTCHCVIIGSLGIVATFNIPLALILMPFVIIFQISKLCISEFYTKLNIKVHKSFMTKSNTLFDWNDFNFPKEQFKTFIPLFAERAYSIDDKIHFCLTYTPQNFLVFYIPNRQNISKKKIESLSNVFDRKIHCVRYSKAGTLIILSRKKTSSFAPIDNWHTFALTRNQSKSKQVYKEIKAISDLIL